MNGSWLQSGSFVKKTENKSEGRNMEKKFGRKKIKKIKKIHGRGEYNASCMYSKGVGPNC